MNYRSKFEAWWEEYKPTPADGIDNSEGIIDAMRIGCLAAFYEGANAGISGMQSSLALGRLERAGAITALGKYVCTHCGHIGLPVERVDQEE